MGSPFPAEKTHYRRGLALGLTLAETFSIVVFILLLACAALIGYERVQRESAEAQRDTAWADLLITQDMVRSDSMSWSSAHAWFERSRELVIEAQTERRRAEQAERARAAATARAEEAESALANAGVPEEMVERLGAQTDSLSRQARELDMLRDSLARSRRELQRADSQAVMAEDVAELVEPLRDQIGDRAEGDSVDQGTADAADRIIEQAARAERLQDSLSHARDAVAALARELPFLRGDSASIVDSLRLALDASRFETDSLRAEVAVAEQERDDAIGRANRLQAQVGRLGQGTGIDPPPCWMDRDGDPEHLFRVELTDRGMRLFNIAPARRAQTDSEVMQHVAAIEDGRDYDPAAFLRLTLPFYEIGVARTEQSDPRGCRFWVRPVDLTGDRKEIFQERERQLWRRFWFRW